MAERTGAYTVMLNKKIYVHSYGAVVGKTEGQGPLSKQFDMIFEDTSIGEQSWEKAESALQKEALNIALQKGSISENELNYIFSGDLLNQCIGSTFGLKDKNVPFVGLFGACSTMAQGLAIASVFIDSGAALKCAAMTSSHFCSAERQFRYPLEYGGQRPPSAQWTVTGSGAAILSNEGAGTYIKALSLGRIVDFGIKDANNMGAAMAPAAAQTISDYFKDTSTNKDNYDLIVTGDLGFMGSELMLELLNRDSIDLGCKHADCGMMIFNRKEQDVHAGGSGCGCSAAVVCSYILNELREKRLNDVLFIGTGALMSPTSVQQGESIPSIAHLVHFTNE